MTGLRTRAISGGLWSMGGYGLSLVLRLVGNVILAALLFEQAFALMGLVAAIIQGLWMFSDIGLAPNVVQSKRGDDRTFLDTAWTVQVIRGLILAAATTALAWPVAAFYARNDSMAWELRYLLPVVAISVVIGSFQSSKLWTNVRHMKFAANTLIELSSQVVGLATTIVIALKTRSVYALAIGQVASAAVTCVLSHVAIPGPRDRLRFDPVAFRELLHFGKWVFVSTMVSFLALQIDRLAFTRMFPLDAVGVYSVAVGLALLAPALIGRIQSSVAFPLYSRMLERSQSLADIVSMARLPMLAAGSLVVALIMVGSQTFIDLAYDERYQRAGLYVAILASGAWFAVVEGMYNYALLAAGKANWVAYANAGKVLAFCVLTWPLAKAFGLTGAVLAVALSDVAKLLVTYTFARRAGVYAHRLDLAFMVFTAATVASCIWITRGTRLLAGWPDFAVLVLQGVLVVLAFLWPGLRALSVLRHSSAPQS